MALVILCRCRRDGLSMCSRRVECIYAGSVNAIARCERIDAFAHTDTVFLNRPGDCRVHRPAARAEAFETLAEEMGV